MGLEWLTHTGVWNGFHVVYPALQHLTDQNSTSLDLSCGTKTCLNSPTLVVSYEGALFFLPLQRGARKDGFRNPFSMMVGFCSLSGFNLVWLWSPTPRLTCGLRNLDLGFLISDFWFLILNLDVWSCTFGLWNLDVWFGSCESSPAEKQNHQLSLLDPIKLWTSLLDLYWIFDYLQNLK